MILNSILILGGSGLIFGVILAVVSRKFAVAVDPKEELITKLLPGVNCGACGFPGCSGYANAMVTGKAAAGLCPAASGEAVKKIGEILGIEVEVREKKVAKVMCGGQDSELKYIYRGIESCFSARQVAGGFRSCGFSCLGLGDCVKACPVDAINYERNRIPEINPEKCTACGKCLDACPVKVIRLVPAGAGVYVKCNSNDRGPAVKKICKTGCFTCKICVKFCPQQAISIVAELAVIDYRQCNNCGICVQKCPAGTILFTPAYKGGLAAAESKAETAGTNNQNQP